MDPERESREALRLLLDRLYWVVLSLGSLGLLASMWRVADLGWHLDVILDIALFSTSVAILACRKQLGLNLTAFIMTSATSLHAVGNLWSTGLFSLAPVILLTTTVFVGVFFGARWVLVALILALVAYALVALGHILGWAPGVPDPLHYLHSTEAWVAKIAGFGVFVVVNGIAIQSLRKRLFAAVARAGQQAAILSESEQKYRMLAENIEDGLVVQDENFKPVFASPSALRMFGLTPEELPHVRTESLMTKESGERALQDYANYLALAQQGPVDVPLREYEYLLRDGRHLWCEIRPRFLFDGKGRITGSLVVVRDISARKNIEREKAELQERLVQAEKLESVGRLAGGIAHDFNNHLTGIQGAADLLRLAGLPPPQQKLVQLILSSTQHAADLTRKLLTFARKAPLDCRPVQVAAVLDEVVQLLRRGIDKRIEVCCELDGDLLAQADVTMLASALLNLGLNARDAIGEAGSIRFMTRQRTFQTAEPCWGGHCLPPGAYVEILVSDTGAGMSAEVIDKIFTPFFTTKGQGQGTGLGLAAVYGSITAQGGGIQVESSQGRGSLFCLFLPAAHQEAVAAADADQPANMQKSLRILVVDDEPPVRDVLAEMLSHLSHRVTCCEDGVAALRLLETTPCAFDLVILDLTMPQMSGAQVLSAIREREPDLQVLLSSGHPSQEDLDDLGTAAAGFLAKPYTLERLADALAQVSA